MKLGTQLQIVYLDQLRGQIDDAKTVGQNVAGDAETVTFQGRPRHIHSYLQDFLFPADRIRMPAKMLSGGERNRLLLARLFLQPANVLVLDEPTNDLDAETLELLEDLLVEYAGTLLLVSHDRSFLDEVVTSTLVFEGDGRVSEYSGGYEDWLRQRAGRRRRAARGKAGSRHAKTPAKSGKPKKFLNREQRELAELPGEIEKLEAERTALAGKLDDPALYQNGPARAARGPCATRRAGESDPRALRPLGGARNVAREPGRGVKQGNRTGRRTRVVLAGVDPLQITTNPHRLHHPAHLRDLVRAQQARLAEQRQHGEKRLGRAHLLLEALEGVRQRLADRPAQRAQPEAVQENLHLVPDARAAVLQVAVVKAEARIDPDARHARVRRRLDLPREKLVQRRDRVAPQVELADLAHVRRPARSK